ncbi:SpoIIE family protein phosphatase [Streptomyces sp. NPDC052043]|uniref:SpoIIE family protein phosphatase n=1 Tax=Streptomyces sp. NPDC052043 TaxID=3365684 RepID=UPI0037CE1CC4
MDHPEAFDAVTATAPAGPGDLWRGELPVAGMRLDASGRIIQWETAAEALLGYPASEVLGSKGRPLVPAESRPALQALLDQAIVSGAATGPCTVRHKDGHLVELAVWAWHIPEPGGAHGDVLVFVVDVSVALEARVSRAVLDGLFTHSPIGLSAFDNELRYLRVNTALEAIDGIPEADHLGRRLTEMLPDVNSAEAEVIMQRVLDTGESTVDFRATGRTPATPDEDHTWSCSYFRLEDTQGRPFGVGVSVVDITARHRAEQAAAESRRRLALLNEAGIRIGTTLDMWQTSQELAEVATDGLADIVTVDVIAAIADDAATDPGTDLNGGITVRRLGKAPTQDSPAAEVLAPLGQTLHYPAATPNAQALALHSPYMLTDLNDRAVAVASRHTAAARQLREHGVHTVLMIPLLARGTALGMATFYRAFPARPFSPADVTLACDMASRAAVYLDNARLYTREHDTALTLQRSLLPRRLMPPPGIEVAHCYRPASDVNEVGGDRYDVVAMPQGRAALVVGDVMGHGIAAAAVMGQLRSSMRSLARLELPPARLLRHLDAELAYLEDPPLATCAYVVCDPGAGHCSITRAGHPPPALVHPDGTAELFELPTGPPLGVGGLDFTPVEVPLAPGSILALYTDGLVETRCTDLDQRLAQLRSVLTTSTPRPLDALCRTVLARMAPAGNDDVTLLLARVGHPQS